MRIAIIALGSRGDVQPYIALGKGLTISGHQVRLITHENFDGLVSSHGLTFYPVNRECPRIYGNCRNAIVIRERQFLCD